MSRRRVLLGTAWATPAIVLAVSVPRAAASEGDTVETVDVLSFGTINVSGGSGGAINAHFQYSIDGANKFPETLVGTSYWEVTITGPPDFGPVTGAEPFTFQSNIGPISHQFTDVPPGTYTVTIRVTAQGYDPATDITYVATPVIDTEVVEVSA